MFEKLKQLITGQKNLYKGLIESNPSLKQGMVYCKICDKEQKVDSEKCLRTGWPECCGQTMALGYGTISGGK